ncbi:MAG TPA: aromatic ring-hydroxylating dioxygenase subunit alpha [Acetobacteraceae bacterium]|nr:aromatic ring-hydroxylating dioxygenase subunit alpha [Acetobacteraceae bacterium]
MGIDHGSLVKQGATNASPPYTELFARDSKPLEPALRAEGNYMPKPRKLAFSRYTSRAFAALEMEHLWRKTWQPVLREEDIPEIGDRKPYEVGTLSFIIVRSGPRAFRAFQNSCLHRGTRLCHGPSSGLSFKCPFHGWEWNIDGSLKNVPSRWDFPDVTDAEYHLPEAKTGTWGGFVFINPDPDCGPLEAALGVLPQHFTAAECEDRYTFCGFRKKLRGNWKQAQEAFLEAYHVIETHPNILTYNGDTTTRYDIWDDGVTQVSRAITAAAVPSGHLGDDASRILAAEHSLQTFAMQMPGAELPPISSAETGRKEVADWRRNVMGPALGVDWSGHSDCYMLDANQYFMFPNFFPWYGEGLPLTYVFTPLGDDPNECMWETRLTLPIPPHGPRPPAADLIELDFDTPLAAVPSLGFMAGVFDQDGSNIPLVQLGLRSALSPDAAITLGRYQESRILAFHDMLDKRLGNLGR